MSDANIPQKREELFFFNARKILKSTPSADLPSDNVLLKRTIKIAWPSMTESFLIALVAFVDTMMVSTLGDYAISAVGLTTQPKMLLFSFFMALSIAVSALVARRKGEGDQVSANKVMKNALIIALAAVVVISVSGCVFADSIIKFAGSQSDTHEYAVAYFRIIIAFMFFNVISMTINAAQRGVGNTKIAMRTNIVSNLVNVCFNYLLIGGNLGFPKLGVSGAAIATVIGAGCACAMSLRSVLVSGGYLCLKMKTGLKDPKSLRSMASIGASAFAEQVFLRFGFFVYAIIIASLGTEAFATQQIGANVLNISFSFGDGLSVAAVALVGRSLGEKRIDLAAIYGGFCQRCGLICSAVLSLVYVIFGRSIVELFSDSPEVIEKGTLIMYMMTVIVMFQISQIVYSGCLRGSGDSRFTAVVSFINIAILRPLLAYIAVFVLDLGEYAIIGAWAGLIIDQSLRLFMTWMRFKKGKWMKIDI